MDTRYLPEALTRFDERGKLTADGIPLEILDHKTKEFKVNPDAVAYGLAKFFAKLNGRGLSHACWLYKHRGPNRHAYRVFDRVSDDREIRMLKRAVRREERYGGRKVLTADQRRKARNKRKRRARAVR